MPTRKKPKKGLTSAAAMLAKELAGETPPAEESFPLLLTGALAMASLEPWKALHDSNVFAVDTESGQRWYCIVMGAAQQIYGFQAYRGDAGFALFDDIQSGKLKESSEFFARHDIFTVEFVRRLELTPLDRAILALSPDPIPPASRVPQIRVGRPGKIPWYPTAAEVADIQDCLMAGLLFLEWLAKHPKIDPWDKEGELPIVVDWLTATDVQRIPYPPRPSAKATVVKLDERRLTQLLSTMATRQPGHPLEVDCFLMRSPLRDGGRPYFPWAALACDSSSGFLFPPVINRDHRENVLIECLLAAIESSPYRPAAVHVRDEFSRAALAGVVQAFDLPIEITLLPGIDEARAALEGNLG